MKKQLSLCLLIVAFATGCKKGAITNKPTSPSATVYLPNVFTNTRGPQTVTYQVDAKNRLIDVVNNYPFPAEVRLTYDTNDHLTETDSYGSGVLMETDTYAYSTGIVNVQSKIYTGNTTISASSVLTLNSNLQVIKRAYLSIYETYTYDNAGNVSSYSSYPIPTATTPSYTYNYTYDNKKSSFSNLKGNPNIYGVGPEFANNMLTSTMITTGGNPSTQTTTYTYTYNADDYPVSRTSVITGSTVVGTETFSYTLK